MGNLAKAGKRINYSFGLDKLRDALVEREKRRDQAATYKAIGDAFQAWKQRQQAGFSELNDGGQVANPFAPDPSLAMKFQSNLPELATRGLQAPPPEIPETQTNFPTSASELFSRAKEGRSDFENTIAPLLLKSSTGPEQIKKMNLLGGIIDNQVSDLAPKKRTGVQIDPFKSQGYYDDAGNFVVTREAQTKPTTPKEPGNVYEREFVRDVGGVPRRIGIKKGTGEEVDLGKAYYQPKGSNSDSGLPDVSKLIGKTSEGIQKIKDLKSSKWLNGVNGQAGGYQVKGKDIGLVGKDAGNIFSIGQDELNIHRDKIKQQYLAPVVEAVTKRELVGPGSAIEVINQKAGDVKDELAKLPEDASSKEILKVKRDHQKKIEKVIDALIKAYPEYKEERDLLRSYYELLSL